MNIIIEMFFYMTTDTNIRYAEIPISIIAWGLQHIFGAIRKVSKEGIFAVETLC